MPCLTAYCALVRKETVLKDWSERDIHEWNRNKRYLRLKKQITHPIHNIWYVHVHLSLPFLFLFPESPKSNLTTASSDNPKRQSPTSFAAYLFLRKASKSRRCCQSSAKVGRTALVYSDFLSKYGTRVKSHLWTDQEDQGRQKVNGEKRGEAAVVFVKPRECDRQKRARCIRSRTDVFIYFLISRSFSFSRINVSQFIKTQAKNFS